MLFAIIVSHPASFSQGELVYVNYGRTEDFFTLERVMGINCTGKIVIARYGKIFRGNKVIPVYKNVTALLGVIPTSTVLPFSVFKRLRHFPKLFWRFESNWVFIDLRSKMIL